MFTGIITELGKIKGIARTPHGARFTVGCRNIKKDLKLGDSIAVNGVCLSVIAIKKDTVSFDVVANTLRGTNLKRLKTEGPVNLEKALKLGDTLSGHILSGHVDCERVIRGISKTSDGWRLDINILDDDKKYVVDKASIAVDGISLTIADVYFGFFRVYLIPHTMENTALKQKKAGDYVNIEFDMLAKYAKKNKGAESVITNEMLREKGFM